MYSHPAHVDRHAALATAAARAAARVAVAACVSELSGTTAPTEILLIPAGEFRARDGRPADVDAWRMDAAAAATIIARAEAARGEFVIDYEHQTLKADENGQPAPAAGWFKRLEWREGSGLWAVDVRWTERARAAIEAGEYRYISPVFQYDRRTGRVTGVLMAALTNYPALDGHSDLAAQAAARFQTDQEDDTVDREQLIELLGLAADATDEQINEAIAVLKAKADAAEATEAELAALKAKAGDNQPDPAKWAPVEVVRELQEQVAALSGAVRTREVDELIDQAVDQGKLLPAQVEWARALGAKDIEALKGYIDSAPTIAALSGTQTGGRPPEEAGQDGLSAEELAVCRATGIDPDEYKKAKEA